MPLLLPLCSACPLLCPHRPPAMRTPRRRAMGCPMAWSPLAPTGRGRRRRKDRGTSAVLVPPPTPCRKPPSDAPSMGSLASPWSGGSNPGEPSTDSWGVLNDRRLGLCSDTGGLPLQGALGPWLGMVEQCPPLQAGTLSGTPGPAMCLTHRSRAEAARTRRGAECPPQPLSPVFVFGVPPNKWFWSTGVGGSQGTAHSLLYPGTPAPPAWAVPTVPREATEPPSPPGAHRVHETAISPIIGVFPLSPTGAPFFQSVGSPWSYRTAVSPSSPRSPRFPKHRGVSAVPHGAKDPRFPLDPPPSTGASLLSPGPRGHVTSWPRPSHRPSPRAWLATPLAGACDVTQQRAEVTAR